MDLPLKQMPYGIFYSKVMVKRYESRRAKIAACFGWLPALISPVTLYCTSELYMSTVDTEICDLGSECSSPIKLFQKE